RGWHDSLRTASMNVSREAQSADVLQNGKVLIVGGIDDSNQATATAELYDPASETFSLTGSMIYRRSRPNAVIQLDGTVLLVGGGSLNAEVYDAAAAVFVPVGDLLFPMSNGETSTLVHSTMVTTSRKTVQTK